MQFSIHRIWLLTRKQWVENQQLYILGLLATAGIMAAIILFNILSLRGLDTSTQQLILYVGSTASGAVFASTILSQFNEKIKGIQALTLPASALEKFVMAFIYSLLIFPITYFLIVYPLIVFGHYLDIHVKHNELYYRPNRLYNLSDDSNTGELIVTYFVMQTMALLGSVLFKRYAFIKSLVLVISIFFGARVINSILIKSMIDTEVKSGFDANVQEIYFNNAGAVIHKDIVKGHFVKPNVDAAPYDDIAFGYWNDKKNLDGIGYSASQTKIHHPYNMPFLMLLYLGIPFLWLITWLKLREKQL
ncbi:hypothetical protein [Mucilaginibacter flavus]|uniref:hypothetical protein n=1 Tax=Mucilaginibacter flavus TaxID=931504 RepID=UPI0025B35E22|nr:hypothetical protein [Mucilaginibacter flavus]MDN3585034.1 hypothetical protein [Mucilaginibacter flavus]